MYFNRIVGPVAVPLSRALCRTHGAVLNIDFSASDAKQQAPVARRLAFRSDRRRVYGGVTGLGDVALLPLLYTTSERRSSIEVRSDRQSTNLCYGVDP